MQDLKCRAELGEPAGATVWSGGSEPACKPQLGHLPSWLDLWDPQFLPESICSESVVINLNLKHSAQTQALSWPQNTQSPTFYGESRFVPHTRSSDSSPGWRNTWPWGQWLKPCRWQQELSPWGLGQAPPPSSPWQLSPLHLRTGDCDPFPSPTSPAGSQLREPGEVNQHSLSRWLGPELELGATQGLVNVTQCRGGGRFLLSRSTPAPNPRRFKS